MRKEMSAIVSALALAATALAGAATAQEAQTDTVIFDNAIDPNAAETVLASATASETMFMGWQLSYQLFQDAEADGAPAAELAALRAASDAAGAAYEAALIAQNTVELASAEPYAVSDEELAEMLVDLMVPPQN